MPTVSEIMKMYELLSQEQKDAIADKICSDVKENKNNNYRKLIKLYEAMKKAQHVCPFVEDYSNDKYENDVISGKRYEYFHILYNTIFSDNISTWITYNFPRVKYHWDDPDSSYEEDVKYFIRAVQYTIEEIDNDYECKIDDYDFTGKEIIDSIFANIS